jgi:5-formyltetrahydrofolate cyclo-ligase
MAAPHLISLKKAAREAALAAREGLDPALGTLIAGQVLWQCPPPPGAAVAGVWPLPGEVDLRPLLLALAGRGHAVLLPETTPRGERLRFRRWRPGQAMIPGRWGTAHPGGEEAEPDFVLVPLLAWDGAGRRLGYGGGYYDRTLAALPGRYRLGFAAARQRVDEVPADSHDVHLDAVATEQGVTMFTSQRIPEGER